MRSDISYLIWKGKESEGGKAQKDDRFVIERVVKSNTFVTHRSHGQNPDRGIFFEAKTHAGIARKKIFRPLKEVIPGFGRSEKSEKINFQIILPDDDPPLKASHALSPRQPSLWRPEFWHTSSLRWSVDETKRKPRMETLGVWIGG